MFHQKRLLTDMFIVLRKLRAGYCKPCAWFWKPKGSLATALGLCLVWVLAHTCKVWSTLVNSEPNMRSLKKRIEKKRPRCAPMRLPKYPRIITDLLKRDERKIRRKGQGRPAPRLLPLRRLPAEGTKVGSLRRRRNGTKRRAAGKTALRLCPVLNLRSSAPSAGKPS